MPMGYIYDNLRPGEKIVYQANLHWIMYVRPGLFLVAVCLPSLDLLSARNAWAIPAVSWVIGILWIVSQIIRYYTSEFAVTNLRVVAKIGWVRIDSREILLSKIESVSVNQSVLGRVLNYGTVVVEGTGGGKVEFPLVLAPIELRGRI